MNLKNELEKRLICLHFIIETLINQKMKIFNNFNILLDL